jgi:hypothetical protein
MATEVEAKERVSVPRRRFTLLDSMILVAATAAGYAVVQWSSPLFGVGAILDLLREMVSSGDIGATVALLSLIAMPVMASWSLALIPLRLIGPRPRWRRLARQPGLVAALAVATALGFVAMLTAVIFLGRAWGSLSGFEDLALIFLPVVFGMAVLAAWVALVAGRRWRPEPSWVDRLGRALGLLWILIALASPLFLLFL